MKVILASGSPRRKELLDKVGYDVKVVNQPIDETLDSQLDLTQALEQLALQKGLAIGKQDDIVIAADTVVVFNNEVLGKPRGFTEAFNMLKKLSNQTHEIITAVAIINQNKTVTFHEKSYVTFEKLSDKWITEYCHNYQPYDKAGSYGIQDSSLNNHFVKELIGDYDNVLGLPTTALLRQMEEIV